MKEKLSKLKSVLAEIDDLQRAGAVLAWDQQTYMPSGAAIRRSQQLGTLQSLAHAKLISTEVGNLLDQLAVDIGNIDPDSDEARLVSVTSRNYQRAVKVPPEWVTEFAQTTSMATQVWQEARAENDFAIFQPHLEHIIDLGRMYAEFFAPYDHVYDPLLDDFEPGLKTKDVIAIFDDIRPKQVELIRTIGSRPQVDASFLYQHFDEQAQWDFGAEVISRFGFDWQHGRQDRSPHPFTTSFGHQDVRITTRIQPDFLGPALFGSIHECGHAMYEAGIDPSLGHTPLEDSASLAFHESQSRLYENLIGRSYPFWEYFYPRLQRQFPEQLGQVDLDTFYKGINRVEPTLIRVEADEATYNLHIMLRLEIEIALMEGRLDVKDLPEAWNQRMQDYLGISPTDDANGVLQDIHWSAGSIGYFSTYALGNLISVQLWDSLSAEISDIEGQIRAGEFNNLLQWLRKNIHRHGRKFDPQELVQRITGSPIDAAPYLRYLKDKYSKIYDF